MGPSGSGKTSIIRLLFRLYDVGSGQILINGKDIRELKLFSLRDKIGYFDNSVTHASSSQYSLLFIG